jgi:hypothetical protein
MKVRIGDFNLLADDNPGFSITIFTIGTGQRHFQTGKMLNIRINSDYL